MLVLNCSVRLAVRSRPFHGRSTDSNSVPSTKIFIDMKKLILLLIVMVSMSGCYVTFRTPYGGYNIRPYMYSPRSYYHNRVIPGRTYRPYFMPGRY